MQNKLSCLFTKEYRQHHNKSWTEISDSNDSEYEDDLSSVMLRRVVSDTDVSEVLIASIIRAMMMETTHICNVGKLLQDYTAQQPRRQS
jgi:hypothetical protein